ncbi:MAG: MFS transporter [Clostridiaceae bacterium]|nr:MFS transporter [Clostridiaceae bacterium]
MENPSVDWKRKTLLFMVSQAISLFGSLLVSYAILWRITLDTQSGFMMTLYLLFGFLPTFFLSPFAGVWADRYDRKRLIMLADGLIATATLIMALFFLSGYRDLWLFFVIALIRALGSAVQTPAVSALLPQIVPEDRLMKTNGLFSSLTSAIMLISPMISGALLNFTSIEVILMIDVVTAIGAILVMLTLRVPAHVRSEDNPNQKYWQDLVAGVRYIRRHEYIGRFFIYITLLFIMVTPVAILTPLQVTRTFGEDIWRLTAIEVVFSSGMLAGGLLIASWGGFRNRIKTIAFSTLMVGITTFLLGVVPHFWIYLGIMTITGVTMPFYQTPATVMLQEKVEPDFQGRVFGVMGMIASGVMPTAMFIFGPLADRIRIEWLFIGSGVLLTILAGGLAMNKVLINAGEPVQAARVIQITRQPVRIRTECPIGQPDCQL